MKKFFATISVMLMSVMFTFAVNAEEEWYYPDYLMSEMQEKYNDGQFGDEVFCLYADSPGLNDKNIYIYIEDDTATLVYVHGMMGDRYKTRQLTDEEFDKFTSFITENSVDTLDDYANPGVTDATSYHYIHFSGNESNYVYMYAPGFGKDEIYKSIVNLFYDLTETGEYEVGYFLGDKIEDVEVLIKNEDYKVQSVWKNGDDFRVCIDESGTLVWRDFSNGVIGDVVEEPDEITLCNAWSDIPEYGMVWENGSGSLSGYSYQEHLNNFPWQCSWNSYCVRIMQNYDTNIHGLWLTKNGEEPILIKSGTYASPVVIPDTDFVVCAKAENGWAKPNTLVKINLQTYEEETLNIEAADTLEPYAYMNGKLLINRNAEKYFYDIETGNKEQIYGDFGHIDLEERFLQKSSVENEYYAVEESVEKCVIGKVNTETFKFTPIAEYEGIYFGAMDAWVDEENEKVYVVVNEDLISLPLNPKVKEKEVQVNVNGKNVKFDQTPVIINDRVMIPVRAVCEKLGATVEWNGTLRETTIYNDDVKMVIGVGRDYLEKYNSDNPSGITKISLDAPAQIIGDRVLLPIRAVCENLGATVNWNETERRVEITAYSEETNIKN